MRHRQYLAKQFKQASSIYEEDITVFLAGPYIQPKEPMPEGEGVTPAHKARYFLYQNIFEKENITPSLGEHKDLLNLGYHAFGDDTNAHVAELLVAKEHSDAVIILPSSPGSFCEIGLFVEYKEICEKMLVIVDEKYKDAVSYFSLGPIKEALNKNSRIEYCCYDEHGKLGEIASDFLNRIVRKKALKRLRESR